MTGKGPDSRSGSRKLSRRVLLAGALAAPIAPIALSLTGARASKVEIASLGDEGELLALCAEWRCGKSWERRFHRTYGRIEARLMARMKLSDWRELSPAQQRDFTDGRRLLDMKAKFEIWRKADPSLQRRIRKLPAHDVNGVLAKLAIVAEGMLAEDNPSEYRLLRSAIADLSAFSRINPPRGYGEAPSNQAEKP